MTKVRSGRGFWLAEEIAGARMARAGVGETQMAGAARGRTPHFGTHRGLPETAATDSARREIEAEPDTGDAK